jgi:hypothetical protein
MCPELAALRAGYVLQELGHRQRSAWGRRSLAVQGVQPYLAALEEVLCARSDRLNQYQRAAVVELVERIDSRHEGACSTAVELFFTTVEAGGTKKEFEDRLPGSGEMAAWKNWQRTDWGQLQLLFQRITEPEAAWFRIGDRLGGYVAALREGSTAFPLSGGQWNDLYSGVDRLPERIRRSVERFFPTGYRSCLHLAAQLAGTYQGLCEALEGGLLETPVWDGVTLFYRGRRATPRPQSNSVIIPILDLFQQAGWPDSVPLPPGLQGDISQAFNHFNERGVIRLGLFRVRSGRRVRWL